MKGFHKLETGVNGITSLVWDLLASIYIWVDDFQKWTLPPSRRVLMAGESTRDPNRVEEAEAVR